jgi:hypothetical protein
LKEKNSLTPPACFFDKPLFILEIVQKAATTFLYFHWFSPVFMSKPAFRTIFKNNRWLCGYPELSTRTLAIGQL